jgi:hypothetical protein
MAGPVAKPEARLKKCSMKERALLIGVVGHTRTRERGANYGSFIHRLNYVVNRCRCDFTAAGEDLCEVDGLCKLENWSSKLLIGSL